MKRDAVRKEQDEENDVGERCRKGQMRTKKMAHSQTNIWQHWARERERAFSSSATSDTFR